MVFLLSQTFTICNVAVNPNYNNEVKKNKDALLFHLSYFINGLAYHSIFIPLIHYIFMYSKFLIVLNWNDYIFFKSNFLIGQRKVLHFNHSISGQIKYSYFLSQMNNSIRSYFSLLRCKYCFIKNFLYTYCALNEWMYKYGNQNQNFVLYVKSPTLPAV